MIKGIKIGSTQRTTDLIRSGFHNVEADYKDLKQGILESGKGIHVLAVSVNAAELNHTYMKEVLEGCTRWHAEYLIIETECYDAIDELNNLLLDNTGRILQAGITVCIENGYVRTNQKIGSNGLTCAKEYLQVLDALNKKAGRECFGAALNLGHANLLGCNVAEMIRELGYLVKYIHANDNDGIHDLHQIPYTFTAGRGTLATNWYTIIGSIAQMEYHGPLVFDVSGLWATIPSELGKSMFQLLQAIGDEWIKQITLEDRLNQKNKTLILFGAGNMFHNYMKYWGGKYPPAFLVDNNFSIWGEKRLGIEVCSPERILEIPEEQRNVLICNIYYKEIQIQLEEMGIHADWFEELYWL